MVRKVKRLREHNYLKRVIKLAQELRDEGKLPPGSVYQMSIAHDDWCSILNGCGPCDCNPDIEVKQRKTRD